jgi:hypothetical protein
MAQRTEPFPAVKMAQIELGMEEFDMFDSLMEDVFPTLDQKDKQHREWYDRHARVSVRDRTIAWKNGQPFTPDALFF